MDVVDDHVKVFRTEWSVLCEKLFHGDQADPVFEGVVKEFQAFDEQLARVLQDVEAFLRSTETLCEGLGRLSETLAAGVTQTDDAHVSSDCIRMKEASNAITRVDAPHSSLAKLRRDMDYNVLNPIRAHLANNRTLKSNLELRRRHLLELNAAQKAFDEIKKKEAKKEISTTDKKYMSLESTLESAKLQFGETDKQVFEWLYTLEEYKGDVMDSTMQTVKYLQYEFFASSSHAISGILPERIEFRPMVEMVPDKLQVQVDLELEEMSDSEISTDFSTRLIQRQAKDGQWQDDVQVPVDPLSLSSLMSQGFDESRARRALRVNKNDTQAALEWLVNGDEGRSDPKPEQSVRMPTTIKRIAKLKEKRRLKQEQKDAEKKAEEKKAEEPKAQETMDAKKAEKPAPAPAPAADLLDLDSPARPAPTHAPNPVPAAPLEDLLGLEVPPQAGAGYPSQPAPPAQTVDLI